MSDNDKTHKAPTVSVIVPNYNYARYLGERMESILGQTWQDFEIILLDDCSTDNSRDLLESYRGNPKVSAIIYADRNSGSPFVQWFKGIAAAKGKYIWIAEADDSAKPEFLAEMMAALDANPGAALAISGTEVIDETGDGFEKEFDRWATTDRFGPRRTIVYDGRRYLVHNMYWACYVYNASCILFRKSAFEADDYSASLGMRNAGDWLFWSRMLCHGDIVEVRRKISFLRRHGGSVTAEGSSSGNLLMEDMKVVGAIERMTSVGIYRRAIRHGEILKRIYRLDASPEEKARYLRQATGVLGARRWEYLLERVNKPFSKYFRRLITSRNDLI